MKTLKLGIDLDGVLANFTDAFAKVVNSIEPGTVPDGYEPPSWHWPILSRKLENAAWEKLKVTPNWWKPVDAHAENVKALDDFLVEHLMEGVEVYFVTSRVPSAGLTLLAQCTEWLMFKSLGFTHTSVIPVRSGSDKGLVYVALGCQYSIDDRDKNVLDAQFICDDHDKKVREAGAHDAQINHKAFILSRPWNASFYWPLYRVSSMAEFLERVWTAHTAGTLVEVGK